jgi:hypothetical protein
MMNSDSALRKLVEAIAARDAKAFSRLITASPALAKASFQGTGATRLTAKAFLIPELARYINRGDTALHFAAAAYEVEMARSLLSLGADVRAKNRLGAEPLHAAAVGGPNSPRWNPDAQCATIALLVETGADPNAVDKLGASPLHKAVRTRCANAVQALIAHGANPDRKNKRGSTPLRLAQVNSGRGGTGSAEAKAQQAEIQRHLGGRPRKTAIGN